MERFKNEVSVGWSRSSNNSTGNRVLDVSKAIQLNFFCKTIVQGVAEIKSWVNKRCANGFSSVRELRPCCQWRWDGRIQCTRWNSWLRSSGCSTADRHAGCSAVETETIRTWHTAEETVEESRRQLRCPRPPSAYWLLSSLLVNSSFPYTCSPRSCNICRSNNND